MAVDIVDLRDAGAVVELFDRAADIMRSSPLLRGCALRLARRGRLLITGDLHDNPFHLHKIIRLAKLDQSPDHHVVLHEMIHGDKLINGMDFSHRMLARVAELIQQFPNQVHPLLANHELAQMTGKGVSKGAGNNVELFNDAVEFAYGESAFEVTDAIHRFIRAMPLALITESGFFCAHSIPGSRVMNRFDIDVLDRELTDDDYQSPLGSAYLMVWGRQTSDVDIERLAQHWNVQLLCLGHDHVETGLELMGSRLIRINSDHDRAAVLPIDLTRTPNPEEAVMAAIPLSAVN